MAASISRRAFVCSAVATAAAIAVPAMPSAATPPVPAKLFFAAGTPGEFDWHSYEAATAEQAKDWWLYERFGDCECQTGSICDRCSHDVDTAPLNVLEPEKGVEPADWIRSGIGACCDRCGYETFPDNGGCAVGAEAVCEDCMQLADWDIVDPERAAELREDAECS